MAIPANSSLVKPAASRNLVIVVNCSSVNITEVPSSLLKNIWVWANFSEVTNILFVVLAILFKLSWICTPSWYVTFILLAKSPATLSALTIAVKNCKSIKFLRNFWSAVKAALNGDTAVATPSLNLLDNIAKEAVPEVPFKLSWTSLGRPLIKSLLIPLVPSASPAL